jgi:hypothetical protein
MRLTILIMFMLSPFLYSTDFKSINEVELELFELSRVDSTLVIKWETATEFNNKYFLLERSLDHQKLEFEIIDTLDGAKTSITNKKYTSIDSTLDFNYTYYYRLSTVALDGTVQVFNNLIVYTPSVQSSVIESDNNLIMSYELQEDSIVLTSPLPIHNQITLISLDGRTIHPNIKILNDENYSIDISDLPNGKYILLHNQNLICKFVK